MRLLTILLTLLLTSGMPRTFIVSLPVDVPNRHSLNLLALTTIGEYGIPRKGRAKVPKHLHTGIDIKRPNSNYINEVIYPIAEGIVISKRTDGPYAQIIMEHEITGKLVWSVYEHIAGILVNVGDAVSPNKPIARFMNKVELNKHGWQFDHFHLEILKRPPLKLATTSKHPQRHFNSYTLSCYDQNDLNRNFYDPIEFFEGQW
jgi:hypothetical protein